MANEWLRLWHDMPNDPKFKTVARIAKQPISLVLSVYLHQLVDASRNVTRGHVKVTVEDLASALDVEEDQILSILNAMEDRLIKDNYLTGWDARQVKKEDSGNVSAIAKSAAERKQAERARNKIDSVTACHEMSRDVTTDKDKDKDKELRTNPPPPISDEAIRSASEKHGKAGGEEKIMSTAVALSIEFRKHGVKVQAFNPVLEMMAKQGITVDLVSSACAEAKVTNKNPNFGYVKAIMERWSNEASMLNVAGATPPPARASPGYHTANDKAKAWADKATGKARNEQCNSTIIDLNTLDSSCFT